MELNRIYNEDCLEGAKRISDGSVDLILTDLPYGNMKGIDDKHDWDIRIEPKLVHDIANRVLRKNGKMILFSQEPYTTELVINANPNVPFSYRAIWEKDSFANALLANKAMVGYYEDILIFSKTHDTNGVHPLRAYFAEVLNYIGLTKKNVLNDIGQRADHVLRVSSAQFSLCTEATYNDFIKLYHINLMKGFKTFEELKGIDEAARDEMFPSVFNLWEGGKHKPNILKYKKDYTGHHPTQKPVLLLEDLIKTFSNEGDVVVDMTIGSGSTSIAAINTNRNYIGFELDEDYYDIANERIAKHNNQIRFVIGNQL